MKLANCEVALDSRPRLDILDSSQGGQFESLTDDNMASANDGQKGSGYK